MKQKLRDLIAKINDEGQDALDELVHDLKAGEASDINNSGIEGQVAYLLKALGEKDTERELEKIASQGKGSR